MDTAAAIAALELKLNAATQERLNALLRNLADARDSNSDDELGTIDDACKVLGGSKPISRATFYRGVKAGRYRLLHPSPGISRVNLSELREDIRDQASAR